MTIDYQDWLKRDNKRRVILVELDYMYQVGAGVSAVPTLGTIYLADAPFIDQLVPRPYIDAIANNGVPTYARALDRSTLSGRYSASLGSLELDNDDGRLDYILGLAIDGSEIRFFIGDESWPRTDFLMVFTALSAKASAPSADRISISLKDTSLLLNKSIGGTVAVGGTGTSKDRFRPYNFGFVHQVEAISKDSAALIYVHSDTGVNTAAVAVRDRGVAVSFTDNGDGTFTLNAAPAGAITCDVLSYAALATSYRLSDAMTQIVGTRCGLSAAGRYAGPGGAYVSGGVNDYHVGIDVGDKRNVIDMLDDLMITANSFWAINRFGQFYYNRMRPDALPAILSGVDGNLSLAASITDDDDAVPKSFRIDHNLPTYSAYQLFANVNWFSQSDFASSLTMAQRDQFTRKGFFSPEYYGEEPTTTSYLGGTVSWRGGAPQLYHLSMSNSQLISTLISGATDTAIPDAATGFTIADYMSDWSSVRRSQFLPWMEFIDITVGLEFYPLEIGDVVNLTMANPPRFGLEAGVLHQVCSVDLMLSSAQVQLGLVRRNFSDVDLTPLIPPNAGDFLLMETGSYILLETGDKIKL